MNDNARKWVEALRSGEFEQAKDALRSQSRYCCLGVACELYRRETGIGEWYDQASREDFRIGTDVGDGILVGPVKEWLGLRYPDASYGDTARDALTVRNDEGATFDQIADLVESAPGLFA